MKTDDNVGRVAGVSMRGDSGVPKFPQTKIRIGAYGLTGDFHEGQINKHKKVGAPEPNSRQLTIVAKEALHYANNQFDLRICWGKHFGRKHGFVGGLGSRPSNFCWRDRRAASHRTKQAVRHTERVS